jgi:hypothetical protein
VPILPVRFGVVSRAATPTFFSSGDWREYVRPGSAVLVVPPPDSGGAAALHWQVASGLAFPLVEGYFVGPGGPDRQGIYGAERRGTALLLAGVSATGKVPPIGAAERTRAQSDLGFWRADVVVLPEGVATMPRNEPALRAALEALFGPGQRRDDVLVWDVRGRTGR